jgi:uncharacterized protein (TIGR02597 family)
VKLVPDFACGRLASSGILRKMRVLEEKRIPITLRRLGVILLSPLLILLGAELVKATPPVGFSTTTVRGKGAKASEVTFMSVGLPRPRIAQAIIQGHELSPQGRSVLTFSADIFATTALAAPASPHYVHFANGSNSGLVSQIVGNTSTSIELADNVNDVVVPGQTVVRIHPYWTLGTLFPSGSPLGGGLTAASADTVTLLPGTGVSEVYYYSTSAKRWQRGLQDASNVKIPPATGLMITRRRSGDVNVTVSGEVSSLPVEVSIPAAASTSSRGVLLGNPYPIQTKVLKDFGLYSGTAATGLAGGVSAASADNVITYNPATGLPRTYYYNVSSRQWRTGLLAGDMDVIPPGGAFQVIRKSARPSFNWYIPAPQMQLE